MKKRLLAAVVLIAYAAILIDILVFRNLPTIRTGHLILNLGGADTNGQANVVPLRTILSYLFGDSGSLIGGINLVGNVILLMPIGFLVPLVFRTLTWKKALALAVATGFAIEGMQVLFRVGIFDIDDVILNGLGFIVGYWAYTFLAARPRSVRH